MQLYIKRSVFICALFILVQLTNAFASGDRNIDTNIVYPTATGTTTGAFFTNTNSTARVINVTNPPTTTPSGTTNMTAATGNGTTDDTAALISVFNYIKAQSVATSNSSSYILYFPNGTYLVSNTIFYTGAAPSPDINNIHIIGQSRAGTIIKLQDNDSANGFTTHSSPKAVLRFSNTSTTYNGSASTNVCENLTINTGTGNLGAVGIQFQSANSGRISNVAVTSADYNGCYGIWLSTGATQAYMKDINIIGFDSGIYSQAGLETDTAWEHVTCTGQNIAAVTVADGGISIRDLFSQQERANAYAVQFTQQGGSCALLDSWCICTSTTNPCVSLTNSAGENFFARNDLTRGYGSAVKTASTVSVAGPYVSEYTALAPTTLFTPQDTHSFALSVSDTPTVAWVTDMTQWVNVEDYRQSGYTDDQTVQAAFTAAASQNKSVVYFPKQTYTLTQSVNVPACVTRIENFYGGLVSNNYISPGVFNVNATSSTPLTVSGFTTLGYLVNLAALRTVIDLLGSGDIANSQSAAVNTYIEACRNIGNDTLFATPNQHVWARSLNQENKVGTDFATNGGNLWIFGSKTESGVYKGTSLTVTSSGTYTGTVESLGSFVATVGPNTTTNPILSNSNCNMCYNGFTGDYFYSEFATAISEFDGTVTGTFPFSSLPPRDSSYQGQNTSARDISLYVGGSRPSGPFGIFSSCQDIGSVAVAGSSNNYNGSTYIVQGSGADIANLADAFQFVSTAKNGDGTITAEVMSVDNTNAYAKSGVMFRDGTTDPGAVFVDVVLTAAQGVYFQYRSADNANYTSLASNTTLTAPYWVRLTRSGSNFSAYTSPDGTTWTQLGTTQSVPNMPTAATAGLCVTAHNNSSNVLCRSILNGVQLQ